MRLLVGPPGSGKTTLLLEEARRRVRAGAADFRFVTPTATMAEHVRNLLAREGCLVRLPVITTIAGLVDELAPGPAVASADDLRLLTARALDDLRPPAFEALRGSPGFAAALARAMEELASAGCGSGQWAALRSLRVWRGKRLEAFGAVYEAVEELLRTHGLEWRAARLAQAARRVRENGAGGLRLVMFDGFFTFSSFELQLIRELARQSRVTLALPAWEGANDAVEQLQRAGFKKENLLPVRPEPERIFCPAPNEQREAEEIVARVLEARDEGLAWRDCGVVMRDPARYGPILETAFSRAGIPFRAYYPAPLQGFSAPRCLTKLVDACAAGWEHEALLSALEEPACQASAEPGFPGFSLAVRRRLPGEGLADPIRWAEAGLRRHIETLARWTDISRSPRTPREWAAALALLLPLLRPPAHEGGGRARGLAVRGFLSCVEAASRLLPDAELPLADFWVQARPALADAQLRDPGRRRDAVHLLDAYEARQWELPAVFVCGLSEGEFPRRAAPDPVLTDPLRLRLRQQGVPVAWAPERDAEERFLFTIAMTRATRRTVCTWPQFNAGGEPVLKAFVLDGMLARHEDSRRVAFQAKVRVPALAPPALDDPALRAHLAERFRTHDATALESFLQCPFQFYLRHAAQTAAEPETPAARLNPLFTGIVLHDSLKAWHQGGGPMEQIFESVWRQAVAKHRIPAGHAAELQRSILRRSLMRYAEASPAEPGWRIHAEQAFELELSACTVAGRIDRFDVNSAGEVRVFDYKYTTDAGLRRRQQKQEAGLSLQGGLYLLALERMGYTPLSFALAGVKNEFTLRVTDEPAEVARLMEQARANAEAAAVQILNGRIEVMPSDPDACAWCDYRDACRIQSAGLGEEEAGEAAS